MAERIVSAGARRKMNETVDPDASYEMSSMSKLGHAIIVNNVAKEMPGSMMDVKALKVAFQTVGFDVAVHTDLGKTEMSRLEEDILNSEKHKNSNCFAMVIICHGNNKAQLKDVNKRKAWDIEELVADLSVVETLVGKPKILILQCCRGGQTNLGRPAVRGTLVEDEDVTKPQIVADKVDFYVAYATVPGYTEHGSEYLQSFSSFLKENYKEKPLDRIYLMVKQHMGKTSQGEQQIRQCSEVRDSLTKVLHFGPYHGVEISKEKSHKKEIENLKQQVEDQKMQMEREMNEMKEKMERMKTRPSSKTGSRKLEVELYLSENIDLEERETITVVKETGQVVVSGMKAYQSPVILLFTLKGGKLRKEEIQSFCGHEYPCSVLSITTSGGEQLGVLCPMCSDIKLLNLKTRKMTTAFEGQGLKMLCHGDQNILYTTTYFPWGSNEKGILKLDCSEIPFKRLGLFETESTEFSTLCYAPSPYEILITGYVYHIEAVSCDQAKTIWILEDSKVFDGKKLNHQGVVYSARHNALLVCDNSRILVLDPRDGSHLQTIELPGLGRICELCPLDGRLIVLHKHMHYCLSFFHIN